MSIVTNDKKRRKNKIGIFVDSLMYVILLIQMLYVFAGNVLHEILGILMFVCLTAHICLKRKRIKAVFKKGAKKKLVVRISEIITILLLCCMFVMVFSSMGVSRTLFPWFHFMGNSDIHRYLATGILALSVIHGGLNVALRSRRKKAVFAVTAVCTVLSLILGLWAVPYMNRHFRQVDVDFEQAVSGEKASWSGQKPLVVYFTRVGNTDFDEDVDIVSGASLMLASGKKMGNTELLAEMLCDMIGCESKAITLTGEKYPSSYNDTIAVAGTELKEDARPDIQPVNISEYGTIILVYPIWWGTIPMPVATFLTDNDFTGKEVLLLATQGSSGFAKSTADVKELIPGASVKEGISIYCDDIPKAREEIRQWINQLDTAAHDPDRQ